MATRTRVGWWRVRCPECGRPRIIREGRFTILECKCGIRYRAECNGETTVIKEER